MDITARAEVAVVAAARDASDFARAIAGEVTSDIPALALIRDGRQLRVAGLAVLDRIVVLAIISGASWEDVAQAMMLPTDEMIRRYGPVVSRWRAIQDGDDPAGTMGAISYGDLTTGLPTDPDIEGTAVTLDQWLERHSAWEAKHREPWETPGPTLASRFA